ncbi:S-layer homology domain-containing protein [Thermovenabulum sp.]|uniref:S-layer homology domain-containing protein n=1 Tax=Thermovenabulum sp. TaxID=3100335 RepID=UPI003C7DB6B0
MRNFYIVNKKFRKILIMLLIILILLQKNVYSLTIDDKFLNRVFDKINALDPDLKNDAFNLLESYFLSPQTLENLKTDLPGILSLVIGSDYEKKLSQEGITLQDINKEIDNLKNWTREDRMKLLEFAKEGDKEGIKNLYEKYEDINTSSGSSSGMGGGSTLPSNIPQQIKITFNDITNHWAKTYIEEMASRGIIKGIKEGIFAPNKNVTRAEFTAMLVRLLNLEQKEINFDFADVKKGQWYYDVIKIAFSNDLVKGKGNIFEPNAFITREEMVVLITRAASLKNKSTFINSIEENNLLTKFQDNKEISSWARTEIAVALKLGLVKGKGDNIFSPKSNATRAEAATMIYNLYNYLNKN